MDALIRCPPVSIITTRHWQRKAPILMTWGLGHQQRRVWTNEHMRLGGHVVGLDLGYWNRECQLGGTARVTIDHDHPWRMIKPMSPERFAASGIKLRDDYDPDGPIVLAGMGYKQRNANGVGRNWETNKASELRERFPGKQILYRPKRPEAAAPGTQLAPAGKIHSVLAGASLLVCRHSNVAVDACIAGVPVECEDGAAYALYRHGTSPAREQRLSFLQSLAHWQYTPAEAPLAWKFILGTLNDLREAVPACGN